MTIHRYRYNVGVGITPSLFAESVITQEHFSHASVEQVTYSKSSNILESETRSNDVGVKLVPTPYILKTCPSRGGSLSEEDLSD